MAQQIVGYYTSHKEALLKDFERTSALMRDTLVSQFGADFTQELRDKVRKEYEALIPEIPFITGGRARMLNSFLLITAQELAVYKALSKLGKSPEDAWQLCHQALRLRVATIPGWKRWLVRKLMFSKLVRMIMASRARRRQKGRFGDFEIEYLRLLDVPSGIAMDSEFRISGGCERRTGTIDLMEDPVAHGPTPCNDRPFGHSLWRS